MSYKKFQFHMTNKILFIFKSIIYCIFTICTIQTRAFIIHFFRYFYTFNERKNFMRLPSSGLTFTNFVGHYIIKEELIIAKEKYSPFRKYEPSYKSIDMSEFSHKHIYLHAYNLPLNTPKKIIEFCNTYGLLISTLKSFEPHRNVWYDIEGNPHEQEPTVYTYDCMTLNDFRKHVGIIKAIYDTYNNLYRKTNGSTPHLLLENLLTLVASRYDLQSLLLLRNFPHMLSDFIFPSDKNTSRLPNICLQEFETFKNGLNQVFLYLFDNLCFYIKHLEESKLSFEINDYGFFSISPDYQFCSDNKEILYDIAPLLLSWRLNELLKNIPVQFSVDTHGELHLNWTPNSLFEYILIELAFDLSPDTIFAICQNPGCNQVFIPTNHSDAMYCTPECGERAAKRRQRNSDKENPDRERQKPQFQSKKHSPTPSPEK